MKKWVLAYPAIGNTDADYFLEVFDVLDGGIVAAISFGTQIEIIICYKGMVDFMECNILDSILVLYKVLGMLE